MQSKSRMRFRGDPARRRGGHPGAAARAVRGLGDARRPWRRPWTKRSARVPRSSRVRIKIELPELAENGNSVPLRSASKAR